MSDVTLVIEEHGQDTVLEVDVPSELELASETTPDLTLEIIEEQQDLVLEVSALQAGLLEVEQPADLDLTVEEPDDLTLEITAPIGPPGPRGPAGPSGAALASEVWIQDVPEATWEVHHGLDYDPNVTIIDSVGRVVTGSVTYVGAGYIRVQFTAAFAGKAILS